jgi:hypothetical protein
MNIDTLLKEITDIFKEEKYSLPKILYHYCNSNALLNFIKFQELYLSDIRGMNDYSEMSYGKKLINESIRPNLDLDSYRNLHALFNDDLTLALNEPFVFCLSAEEQLLSQWINYADHGRGFVVGFNIDPKALEIIGINPKGHSSLHAIDSKIVLSPVIYNNELQKKLIQLCLVFFKIEGYKDETEYFDLANKVFDLPIYILPPAPFRGRDGKLILKGSQFQRENFHSTHRTFCIYVKYSKIKHTLPKKNIG